MVSLQFLPREILDLVISDFDSYDLFSLLRTSRRLYEAVLPTLYRSIVIQYPTSETLNPLLQTIIRRKWLSEVTRELKIVEEWYVGSFSKRFGLSKVHARTLTHAAESLYQNKWEKKKLMADFKDANIDTLVSVLVMSLPNLERLDFVLPEEYQDDNGPKGRFMDVIIRCANRQPPFDVSPRLTRLSSVTTRWWNDEPSEGYGADQINHFLKFPSMRRICAHQMAHFPLYRLEWKYPRQSSVTHLELYNSVSGIDTLVESCKVLKSFVYQHNVNDTGPSVASDVRNALLPFQDTLETLRLDFTAGYEEYGFFGSLVDFTALKHLHIDAAQLIALDDTYIAEELGIKPQLTDLLPKSLETLHIRAVDNEYEDELVAQLKTLAGMAPKSFPLIREILISNLSFRDMSSEQRACAEAGINCTLTVACDCFPRKLRGYSASSSYGPFDYTVPVSSLDGPGYFSDDFYPGGLSSDDFDDLDDGLMGAFFDYGM